MVQNGCKIWSFLPVFSLFWCFFPWFVDGISNIYINSRYIGKFGKYWYWYRYRFWKISISIKYRIDKNLAYRTGLLRPPKPKSWVWCLPIMRVGLCGKSQSVQAATGLLVPADGWRPADPAQQRPSWRSQPSACESMLVPTVGRMTLDSCFVIFGPFGHIFGPLWGFWNLS